MKLIIAWVFEKDEEADTSKSLVKMFNLLPSFTDEEQLAPIIERIETFVNQNDLKYNHEMNDEDDYEFVIFFNLETSVDIFENFINTVVPHIDIITQRVLH